ncbi:MAG: VWA domain-containing protein [Acidobacteria bacterium]|nr:VWA domain-containing protein [Acidobacteriota bacterium]
MAFVGKIATIQPMWLKMLAPAVLFCLIAAQSRPANQENRTAPVISVSVNLVKVPISVFDETGNLVSDLRREDFRVWEDQVPQQIRSFGVDSNPVSVVLLLDTSMSGKSELKKIKEAATEFAEALSREDRISIIGFDDEVYRALDWTNEIKKVRKALGKLRPGIRTALYDAMYYAAAEQLGGIEGRKAVILLTDCLNNESRVGFRDASLAVVQSQASLYVVSKTAIVREQAMKERRVRMIADILKRMYGDDEDYVGEFFKKRESEMSELSEKTGGRCFFPKDYNALKNIYTDVARELKSKYYITYVSNQNLQPDSYHRISIEYLESASKIIYRKGYYHQPQLHKAYGSRY